MILFTMFHATVYCNLICLMVVWPETSEVTYPPGRTAAPSFVIFVAATPL